MKKPWKAIATNTISNFLYFQDDIAFISGRTTTSHGFSTNATKPQEVFGINATGTFFRVSITTNLINTYEDKDIISTASSKTNYHPTVASKDGVVICTIMKGYCDRLNPGV